MSKYAAVNVKFGADISQFSTAMQNAAREMKKAGDQLQNVGKSMTMNLTAPIVALGAAALYSFGQIDALKRGLITFSGSASLAEEEFTKLREVAKLPGIGLEEAVRGSINLQAIGLSADDARTAMMAFGNAIATIGGGKENFDLAIRGFGQLMNASKPLQQDLYQIANQLPQVNKLMIEAFGTNRAEDLAKLGISGKQLADFLVVELGKLPQVSGGIKNSFENMSDSVKISLASFGESIEKNFNISGKINDLSNALSGLINGFSNLKPETQKFILTVVGMVAVIGPLVLGIGVLVNLLPTLMAGFGVFRGAVVLATTALKALSVAMNANWVVALTGVLVLAVVAMKNWGDSTSETTKRLKEQREETKKLADEKERLNNPLLNQKKAAPLEGIDLFGKGSGYDSFRKKGFEGGGGEFTYLGDVNVAIDNTKKQTKELTDAEKAAIKKAGLARSAAMIESYKGMQIEVNNAMRKADAQNNANKFNSDLEKIYRGQADIVGTGWEGSTQSYAKGVQGFTSQMAIAQGKILVSIEELNLQISNALRGGLGNAIIDTFSIIGESIATNQDPFKELGKNLLDSFGKLMKTIGALMITMGLAQFAFNVSLSSLNPIGMIAAGAVLVAAGAGISAAAKKGLKGADSSQSMSSYSGSSSQGQDLVLSTRLDGRDLVMSGQNTSYVKRR
jgi:tape measure domain-containing protein